MSDEYKELLERVGILEQQVDLIISFLEMLQIDQSNEMKTATDQQKILSDFIGRTQLTDKPIGDT